MNPFVGVKQVSLAELRQLLENLSQPSYYFLRWAHQVKWMVNKLPAEFPSPEGQMFNRDRELRWKPQGQGYSVLLLSISGEEPGFTAVGKNWQVQQRNAHIYPSNETRFPKAIDSEKIKNVAQRYFMDAETATVHFVALTLTK